MAMSRAHKNQVRGGCYAKGGKVHPGFKAVQAKIAGEGYSEDAAGAILANATRHASAAAKRKNPKLNKVK